MKEVKYYVSDDGKLKSTKLDDSTFLYKLDGEKDLHYLLKHLIMRHYSELEDNYVGYVISRYYNGPNCGLRELISADQYIKELQSKIDELNAKISTIKNYMK